MNFLKRIFHRDKRVPHPSPPPPRPVPAAEMPQRPEQEPEPVVLVGVEAESEPLRGSPVPRVFWTRLPELPGFALIDADRNCVAYMNCRPDDDTIACWKRRYPAHQELIDEALDACFPRED